MKMDFKNALELADLCSKRHCLISEVMRVREISLFEKTREEIDDRMSNALRIMRRSAQHPLAAPEKSMGGLIGGEAARLQAFHARGGSCGGTVLETAIIYAMAVLETNACMGLIVAAPTAGSAGVIPGVLLALQQEYQLTDAQLLDGLFNASAIGCLAMQNATTAGAVGGCQAEIGTAAAMAASAATELLGGTPEMSIAAASIVLMNMLGLVCDPVLGLVECPCQNRNAAGAANALTAAFLALAGIPAFIPLDEMLDCMYTVGKKIPPELRETSQGGCAATPTACARCAVLK